MVTVYESAIIHASVSDLWPSVGDFLGMSKWHPAVLGAALKSGSPDKVGAVRECELDGGAKIVENQVERSDEKYFYSYSITESPMPMSNHKATIRLRPVTESGATFIEWVHTLDPKPGAEKELPAMISGLIKAGFESLKTQFNKG